MFRLLGKIKYKFYSEMLQVVFTLFMSISSMSPCDSIKKMETDSVLAENLINVDTISFSGIVVLDQIDKTDYFISKNDSHRIKLQYRSKSKFDDTFKNDKKTQYLSSHTLKFLLKKYKGESVISGMCNLHIPSYNGISVYRSDNNQNIYLSFFTGQLYKTSIRGDIVNQLHLLGLDQMVDPNTYIEFYTFTEIHW